MSKIVRASPVSTGYTAYKRPEPNEPAPNKQSRTRRHRQTDEYVDWTTLSSGFSFWGTTVSRQMFADPIDWVDGNNYTADILNQQLVVNPKYNVPHVLTTLAETVQVDNTIGQTSPLVTDYTMIPELQVEYEQSSYWYFKWAIVVSCETGTTVSWAPVIRVPAGHVVSANAYFLGTGGALLQEMWHQDTTDVADTYVPTTANFYPGFDDTEITCMTVEVMLISGVGGSGFVEFGIYSQTGWTKVHAGTTVFGFRIRHF
jgi:hypothetical protein